LSGIIVEVDLCNLAIGTAQVAVVLKGRIIDKPSGDRAGGVHGSSYSENGVRDINCGEPRRLGSALGGEQRQSSNQF
jgi:hypothetical protein